MPCYHPIPAWRSDTVNPETGKRGITFSLSTAHKLYRGEEYKLQIPCGSCVGCQLERARQWAVRCMHEAKLYERNCFLTMTYENPRVTPHGLPTLFPRDVQLFLKRLRKVYGDGIRFFQCGEYGEQLGRPHHHMLLFNHEFPDRRECKRSGSGESLYTSAQLDKLWGHGICYIGSVSFQSAGYVARYAMKKVRGAAAELHYQGRVPEFLTMSRRPGIGRVWAERYSSDWYRDDAVVVNGRKCKPPRYYDDLVAKQAPAVLRRVKLFRRMEAARDPDNTGRRLVVREVVKTAAITFLKRSA